MAVFWRVSRHRDLSGVGGLHHSARWHERGMPVVYLAESPPGAILEVCVHLCAGDLPPIFTMLEVAEHGRVAVEELDPTLLPADWTGQPAVTRSIGKAWLRSHKTALLRVPSALAPKTWNVLLNPGHPDAAHVRIAAAFEFPLDPRVKV